MERDGGKRAREKERERRRGGGKGHVLHESMEGNHNPGNCYRECLEQALPDLLDLEGERRREERKREKTGKARQANRREQEVHSPRCGWSVFLCVLTSLTLSSSSCTRTRPLRPAAPAAAAAPLGSLWRPCLHAHTHTRTRVCAHIYYISFNGIAGNPMAVDDKAEESTHVHQSLGNQKWTPPLHNDVPASQMNTWKHATRTVTPDTGGGLRLT